MFLQLFELIALIMKMKALCSTDYEVLSAS